MGEPKIDYSVVINQIIDEVYEGAFVHEAIKKHGINNIIFYDTLETVPLLAERYSRAQRARAETLVEETIEIADNSLPDEANKARNQINIRMWYAAKLMPQKYGERIDLNVTQTIDLRAALDPARARLRDVIDTAREIGTVSDNMRYVTQTGIVEDKSIESEASEISLEELLK